MTKINKKDDLLILSVGLIFLLLIFFLGQTGRALWTPDEPRVAEISKEMAKTGNLIVPTLNRKPFLEKPPLYFLCVATLFKIIGKENESAVRFPNGLFGFLTALLLLIWGWRAYSLKVGILSALILASAGLFTQMSHWGIVDVALTFFVTLSLYGFFKAKDNNVWFYLFYIGLVGAFYSKGFIGVTIPIITVFFYLLAIRDFSVLKKMKIIQGLIIFLAFIIPWLWGIYHIGGKEYLRVFIVENHINRFLPGGIKGHVRPFYYYFINLPALFLPWTIFFPMAAKAFYKKRELLKDKNFLLLLCWLVPAFFILTISSTKRGVYLLPLFPSLAFIMSILLIKWMEEPLMLWEKFIMKITTIVLFLLGLSIVIVPLLYYNRSFLKSTIFFIIFIISIPFVWKSAIKGSKKFFIATFIIFIFELFISIPFLIYPVIDRYKDYKPFVTTIVSNIPKDKTIFLYKPDETIRAFIPFYTNRYPKEIETLSEIKKILAAKGKKYIVIMERKRHLSLELSKAGLSKPELRLPIYKKKSLALYIAESTYEKNP